MRLFVCLRDFVPTARSFALINFFVASAAWRLLWSKWTRSTALHWAHQVGPEAESEPERPRLRRTNTSEASQNKTKRESKIIIIRLFVRVAARARAESCAMRALCDRGAKLISKPFVVRSRARAAVAIVSSQIKPSERVARCKSVLQSEPRARDSSASR